MTRTSDRASIPKSMDNRDWRAYQAWLADGNRPDPMPLIPVGYTQALYETTRASIITMLQGIQVVQDFANGTTATNAQINANPAVYLRAVARELIEVESALIGLAKIVSGMTDNANTGA